MRRVVTGILSIGLVTLTPAVAWPQFLFDGGAGFGALTGTAGIIGGCPSNNMEYGEGSFWGKARRLTGGEGIPEARDFFGPTFRGGSAVTDVRALATGASGVLHGFVKASPPFTCMGAARSASTLEVAQIYNTYTITSSTLPVGTPVSISLDWTFTGIFSAQTTVSQGKAGSAFACVGVAPLSVGPAPQVCGNLVQPVDSTQGASVSMSNTIAVSTTPGQPLHVGDSFIILSRLIVGAQSESGLGEMTSDFSLNTTVSSTTTGASVAFIQSNRPVAWGRNLFGELGDGTTIDRSTPVAVGGLSNLAVVGAGFLGSLAVDLLGTVWAWGSDINGTSLTPFRVPHPNDPSGFLSDVRGVALGAGHNLAVKRDGTVWAWGNNSNGQLGDGTTIDRLHPVQVTDPSDPTGFLTNVLAVAASNQSSFSLALKHDGTVWAWGRNNAGQLGDNSTTDSLTPVQVQKSTGGILTDIELIAAGSESGLALTHVGGLVWAWGRNNDGALGDGTFTERHSAVQVIDPANMPFGLLDQVAAIAGGGAFSLALKSDGTVRAWGNNFFGQLGNGTLIDSNTPVQVTDPTDPSGKFTGGTVIGGGLAGGIAHSLARKSDGTVRAWGHNPFGELGDGTTTDSATPIVVHNLDHVGPVSAGAFYSLALEAINTPASSGPVTAIGTSPATITFSSVIQGGTTKVTVSSNGPAPPKGFSLDGGDPNAPNPTYYDVTTTATVATPITVCLNYTGTSFAGTTIQPVLKHFDKTLTPPQWVDVMVTYWNETDNIICGMVNSLSPFALMKIVDHTPPTVTCSVVPNMVWPPNHRMVPVTATVTVSDDFSGPAGFTLTSVTSSESDNGLGDGDRPNDIQGFAVGTPSTQGLVRAERSGVGTGRIYTLTFEGRDIAGNSATCAATVTVPHDLRR